MDSHSSLSSCFMLFFLGTYTWRIIVGDDLPDSGCGIWGAWPDVSELQGTLLSDCVSAVRIQILQSNSFQGVGNTKLLQMRQDRMGFSYRFKSHLPNEMAIVAHSHDVVKLLSIFY